MTFSFNRLHSISFTNLRDDRIVDEPQQIETNIYRCTYTYMKCIGQILNISCLCCNHVWYLFFGYCYGANQAASSNVCETSHTFCHVNALIWTCSCRFKGSMPIDVSAGFHVDYSIKKSSLSKADSSIFYTELCLFHCIIYQFPWYIHAKRMRSHFYNMKLAMSRWKSHHNLPPKSRRITGNPRVIQNQLALIEYTLRKSRWNV